MFIIHIQSKSSFTILVDNFIKSFVFFNAIASVNKTELDFSLILCNAICDQSNRRC